MLKKILAYEDSHDFGPWRTRVNCVVGQAGFGRLSEVLGESAVQIVDRCRSAGRVSNLDHQRQLVEPVLPESASVSSVLPRSIE